MRRKLYGGPELKYDVSNETSYYYKRDSYCCRLGHPGQIVTKRGAIIEFINEISRPVTYSTVNLISEAVRGKYDYLRLFAVCARLYYLSKLVYLRKGYAEKPDAELYRKCIFDGDAETKEEVSRILAPESKSNFPLDVNTGMVFHSLLIIEKLWCQSISCISEQILIPELAYAFDYVVKNMGRLPEPQYKGKESLFPYNYENYNYTEGIAVYFEEEMCGVF